MPRPENPTSTATKVPFLVLPENRFAYEALSSIGEGPVRPIYLYGPSGSGKSHLVRYGVRKFVGRHPGARVQQVTAAEFAADFATASSRKTIPLFQAATREFELVVIEDLQTLDRRRETQIQLLALCDELSASGCQVIWTSRNPAGELTQFSRKLVSRFRGGVTARVRQPGPAGRQQLLEHFAMSRQLTIPAEAAQKLAFGLPISPRELWAVLTQLDAIARHQRRPIDSDLVRRFLRHEVLVPRPRLEDVCRAVARQFGVSPAQLRSRIQSRAAVHPRQCAMLIARELTGCSLKEIGHYFGKHDHSTVIHACRRLKAEAPHDAELRLNLSQIEALLGVAEGGAES
jgi:chromosomal replication initiator protein